MLQSIEIKRELSDQLLKDARSFRIVTLLGPRQAGKTTIIKMTFPDYNYVSLEDLDARNYAKTDPKAFLKRYPVPAVYDEIQRAPELLSYIQGIVDEHPDRKGQFILTGSHQPLLKEKISQSLAGRTSLLTLYPLSMKELASHRAEYSKYEPSDWIYKGFLPELYRSDIDPTRAYRAYTQTYVERDVRQLIQIKEQLLFERFLKLSAGRIGQLLNYDSLASDVGVSPKTIKEWISVLEASFLVYRLAPYHKNLGKRIVKTPKLYFTDVGLATNLLGIENKDQVERDPLYGNLFENLVVTELLKCRLNRAKSSELYFYRDSHGHEIDLLVPDGPKVFPVEIKSSRSFNPSLLKGINYYMESVDKNTEKSALIFGGESSPITDKINGYNYFDAHQLML